MADVTGVLHHGFEGRSYKLELTMRGIATLQGLHGNDIAGFLTGRYDRQEGDPRPPEIPPIAVMLDTISVALQKGEGLDLDDADALADRMATADRGLFAKVWATSQPEAEPGNVKTPRTKQA